MIHQAWTHDEPALIVGLVLYPELAACTSCSNFDALSRWVQVLALAAAALPTCSRRTSLARRLATCMSQCQARDGDDHAKLYAKL